MSQARLLASDVLDCPLISLIPCQVSILCRSQMRNWSYIGSWRPGKKQVRRNSQQSPSIFLFFCFVLASWEVYKHQIEQGKSEEESGFSVWVTYSETRAWTCGEGVLVSWWLRRVLYLNVLIVEKSYMLQRQKCTIVTSYHGNPWHTVWTATCFERMQRLRWT